MFPRTLPANHVDTVFSKDDFTAEVAKLKEDETTSVKQFEAGQLEGIFFLGSTRWVQTTLSLLTIVGSQTRFFFVDSFFQTCKFWVETICTPGSTNIAGWKADPDWVDVFPSKHWGYSSQLCQPFSEGFAINPRRMRQFFFARPWQPPRLRRSKLAPNRSRLRRRRRCHMCFLGGVFFFLIFHVFTPDPCKNDPIWLAHAVPRNANVTAMHLVKIHWSPANFRPMLTRSVLLKNKRLRTPRWGCCWFAKQNSWEDLKWFFWCPCH